MTMPLPEFHPHYTSDIYAAAYALQRSGRDGEVAQRLCELLGRAINDHIPVTELPVLNSTDSMLVFAGLYAVLDTGDGDPEALAAAATLLEEQQDPDTIIRHDEEMRACAEQVRNDAKIGGIATVGARTAETYGPPSLSVVPGDFYQQVNRLVEIAERRENYTDCPTGELPAVA